MITCVYNCEFNLKMQEVDYKAISYTILLPKGADSSTLKQDIEKVVVRNGGIILPGEAVNSPMAKKRSFPMEWEVLFDDFVRSQGGTFRFIIRDFIPEDMKRGIDYATKHEFAFKYWLTTKRGCVPVGHDLEKHGRPAIFEHNPENDPELS